jgi:hypothetical protein
MDERTQALLRIFTAAQALERGEENPVEVAQNIQHMVMRGLGIHRTAEWTHERNRALATMIEPLSPAIR